MLSLSNVHFSKTQFHTGGESKQGSQAAGVDELRVLLLSIWLDECPQIPHGLFQVGVCFENCWELADPQPYNEAQWRNIY